MTSGRSLLKIRIRAVDGGKAHRSQMSNLTIHGVPCLPVIKRNQRMVGELPRHLLRQNLMTHGLVPQMMMHGDLHLKRMILSVSLLLNKMTLGEVRLEAGEENGDHQQLKPKKMMDGELNLLAEHGFLQPIPPKAPNQEINLVRGSLYNASIVKKWDMDLEIVQIQRKKGHVSIVKVKVIWQKIALSLESPEKEEIDHH